MAAEPSSAGAAGAGVAAGGSSDAAAPTASGARPIVLQDRGFHALHQPLVQAACDRAGVELRLDLDYWNRVTGAPGASGPPSDEDKADAERVVGLLTHAHDEVAGPQLAVFNKVRVVSNFGVGVDHVSLPDATARGIPVGNTPDCLDDCCADMAWALILAVARRLVEGERIARHPDTTHWNMTWFGTDVARATLGVVGMGSIGSEVARRAQGFKMRVLYHNRRRVSEETEKELGGVTFAPTLDELLGAADYVVLCVPVTPETTNLMGAAQFAAMKRSAFLVNVGRGKLVDQDALYDALVSGEIAGAGLDVTEPEPLPRDHKLLTAPNLTITPHTGSATFQTRARMLEKCIENLEAGLKGEPLPYCVNAEANFKG